MSAKKVKRILFPECGETKIGKYEQNLLENWENDKIIKIKKWDFDFINGIPLNSGKVHWENQEIKETYSSNSHQALKSLKTNKNKKYKHKCKKFKKKFQDNFEMKIKMDKLIKKAQKKKKILKKKKC